MSEYYFAKSQYKDVADICELLYESFGSVAYAEGAMSHIVDRYVLMRDAIGDLISMGGIISPLESEFDGYELTFTCTRKKDCNKGNMTRLFNYLLEDFDANHPCEPLYIMSWNVTGEPFLKDFLKKFGFELAFPGFFNRDSKFCRQCSDCPQRKAVSCSCCDDLYIRQFGF